MANTPLSPRPCDPLHLHGWFYSAFHGEAHHHFMKNQTTRTRRRQTCPSHFRQFALRVSYTSPTPYAGKDGQYGAPLTTTLPNFIILRREGNT